MNHNLQMLEANQMKQTNDFYSWIDRSIARLVDLKNDIAMVNGKEMTPGIRIESSMQYPPSRAEEYDFLNINDWILAQDEDSDF